MANWHGYILITELPPGWTNEQRTTAFNAMRGMGKQADASPAKINHSRARLDDKALLVEAEFDTAEITRAAVVDMIAVALDVNPVAVDAIIEYAVFANGDTWEASRLVAISYLIANAADWEPAPD
jgi:hypothetical protein